MLKKSLFILIFIIIYLYHGYAEDYTIEAISINNTDYYPLYKILNILHLERDYDLYTQRIIIQDKGRYLTFFIDDTTIYYEKNTIFLQESPIRDKGIIYIPESMVKLITDWKRGDYLFTFKNNDFEIKQKQEIVYQNEEPKVEIQLKEQEEYPEKRKVFNNDNASPNKLKFIIIDAGHGGNDPGAIGQKGLLEKNVVLQVASYLKDILKDKLNNINIVMIRDKDEFITLSDRAKRANKYIDKNTAGLFLSIHANASWNKKSKGTETFVLSPVASDAEARAVAAMENGMIESKKDDKPLNKILTKMLSYEYIRESIQLASLIQNSYVKNLGAPNNNRGIKKALFFVLEETFMPAVLTEIGFITNREEEKLLRTTEYQKQIASSIAEGVFQFVNWYEANNGFIQ